MGKQPQSEKREAKRKRKPKREEDNNSTLGSSLDGRGDFDQDGNRWIRKQPGMS
jgi:hypothetical protein